MAKTRDEFMAWVKQNYGDSVLSDLGRELKKQRCGSRAELYGCLCKVLGTRGAHGVSQSGNLGDIPFNS